jgi:hypothetical protein
VSDEALFWWAFAIALVAVFVLIGMQVARAVREVVRLGARLEAFEDLPVLRALERADADGNRIDAAVSALPGLIERAKVAVATIRQGPFPPEFIATILRVRAEVAAFRRFSAR